MAANNTSNNGNGKETYYAHFTTDAQIKWVKATREADPERTQNLRVFKVTRGNKQNIVFTENGVKVNVIFIQEERAFNFFGYDKPEEVTWFALPSNPVKNDVGEILDWIEPTLEDWLNNSTRVQVYPVFYKHEDLDTFDNNWQRIFEARFSYRPNGEIDVTSFVEKQKTNNGTRTFKKRPRKSINKTSENS